MNLSSFNLPKVAAAIVTYNHRDPVIKLLNSLEQQGIPSFVTENNGGDGAVEAIKNRFPNVSLLESRANLGGCGGFNCAALAALSSGCEYLILIDDDALPDVDCIKQLSDFLDHNPDYIFAAPSIYISSQPDILQEAGGGVNFDRANPIEAWYRFQTNPQLPPILDTDYASACCLMVRADALREMGVLDWAYFIFSDDVDLCLRLRKTFNKKGACITTARAYHDFPWAKPFAPMRLYFFQRNGLRLIANHREQKQRKSLFIALMRLHRRIFYSAFSGDDEIHQTLKQAFNDAWQGKFGNWDKWVVFAQHRQKLDATYFSKYAINRVLIDISIEDFEEDIVHAIHALSPEVSIDILCDAHRVQAHQAQDCYVQVFARQVGFIKPLRILPRLIKEGYDLVICDANMEPRRATSMCAKRAAIFHNKAIYQASAHSFMAALAHICSLPYGLLAAGLSFQRFSKPFPAGKPPEEAASLLNKIGIDSKIGQPYARLESND